MTAALACLAVLVGAAGLMAPEAFDAWDRRFRL